MANLNNARAKITHITLSDGVEREIRFTLNAMAEMEDRYGSVDAAFEALEKGSIKAVRFILYAGLLANDEGLTEQQVGNLIDIQCMEDRMAKVNDALTDDMPPKEETLPNVVVPAVPV